MLNPKNLPVATVVGKKILTDEHFILRVQTQEKINFKPGQYCTLGVDGIERAYSIVSSPLEEYLEFFIELVPEQYRTEKSLTPRLMALKEGDKVTIRPQAKGSFLLDENSQTHVMVATVTGIAPFVSMTRAYLKGYYNKVFSKPFYVFHGASYKDEFGYLEEFKEFEKSEKVIYVPTVSRPTEERNKGWEGQTGRVNLILEDYLKKFDIKPEGTTVYLCGNQHMIEYLANKNPTPEKPLGKLIPLGFNCKQEKYF